MAFKSSKNDIGIAILRIGTGALMLFAHGWTKLVNFSDLSTKFPNPIGIGSQLSLVGTVGAEVFCSILLILGMGTRLASMPLLFTMLVAAFVVHGSDPFARKEMALLYAMIYVTLIFTGGGAFKLGNNFSKLKKWN